MCPYIPYIILTHTQPHSHAFTQVNTQKELFIHTQKRITFTPYRHTHTVSISISVFALKLWQKCKTFSLCAPRFMQHFYDIFHHFIWLVFILGLPQLRSPFRSNWLTVCFPSPFCSSLFMWQLRNAFSVYLWLTSMCHKLLIFAITWHYPAAMT